jgi:hypothetical protein
MANYRHVGILLRFLGCDLIEISDVILFVVCLMTGLLLTTRVQKVLELYNHSPDLKCVYLHEWAQGFAFLRTQVAELSTYV